MIFGIRKHYYIAHKLKELNVYNRQRLHIGCVTYNILTKLLSYVYCKVTFGTDLISGGVHTIYTNFLDHKQISNVLSYVELHISVDSLYITCSDILNYKKTSLYTSNLFASIKANLLSSSIFLFFLLSFFALVTISSSTFITFLFILPVSSSFSLGFLFLNLFLSIDFMVVEEQLWRFVWTSDADIGRCLLSYSAFLLLLLSLPCSFPFLPILESR